MVQALQQEIVLRKETFQHQLVETIYFGGGTPSLLSVAEITALIGTIYEHYTLGEHPEITLEANPDDLSEAVLQQLSKSPINRLSIGVQSFFDDDLQWMHRAHNAQEAAHCLEVAKQYFTNISIDLIYGIPGADISRWRHNVEKALSFHLPHLSAYALTVEPKTALKHFIAQGKVQPADEAQVQAQYYFLVERLEEEGYLHYEISNFGKPGFFSRNNTLYWQGKPYLGIGPSAHSFNGEQRSWNVRNNIQYLKALEQGILPSQSETLTQTDRYNEYIMTGLRTLWGVSLEKVRKDFGNTYEAYLRKHAHKHLEAQLLSIHKGILKATPKGKFLIDGIAADLFVLNAL